VATHAKGLGGFKNILPAGLCGEFCTNVDSDSYSVAKAGSSIPGLIPRPVFNITVSTLINPQLASCYLLDIRIISMSSEKYILNIFPKSIHFSYLLLILPIWVIKLTALAIHFSNI
jgi:hypothetical protein